MSRAKLLHTKKILQLSTGGYDLLDKKAYILSKEMADLKEKQHQIQTSMQQVLAQTKKNLYATNLNVGLIGVAMIACGVETDHNLEILKSSIMGVEVSIVKHKKTDELPVGIAEPQLIQTIKNMHDLKDLLILAAMIEDSISKIGIALKKTQIRVNALKNVVIPRQTKEITRLSDLLEEQDREGYARLLRM